MKEYERQYHIVYVDDGAQYSKCTVCCVRKLPAVVSSPHTICFECWKHISEQISDVELTTSGIEKAIAEFIATKDEMDTYISDKIKSLRRIIKVLNEESKR